MARCGISKYDDLPARIGTYDVDYLRYRLNICLTTTLPKWSRKLLGRDTETAVIILQKLDKAYELNGGGTMRVTSMEKFEITKEQLAKALKVPKINSITWKDSHFKINIQKGIKSINVYLRCEDVKGLLLLDFNIFDENITVNKKGYITYEREVEHIKKKFDLKDLHATIKKALE